MDASSKLLGGLLITLATVSCITGNKNNAGRKNLLKDCPVVGQYVQVGDDKVLSCDQKLLTDTIRLPLSFFTEDMEIVKLDGRDTALVTQCGVSLSDNYILIHSGFPPTAFKLFDRKGNYLTDVGAIGQGPGEYKFVYDAQIDEKNGRVYLMPWQTDNLFAYDLKGKVLDPVPLGIRCPKAMFKVDPEKGTLTVATLPFPKTPALVWVQDLAGNHIQEVAPGHLEVPWTFNNEILCNLNMPNVFDVNLLCVEPTRPDSLYHYDIETNRLRPTFTCNHSKTDPIPWDGFNEWPNHFVGQFSGPPVVQQNEHGTIATPGETVHYIVDKNTCKGAYFKIYNDYFGDQEIEWPSGIFSNGYYIRNMEPGNLLTEIETLLKKSDLSSDMRKKLTDIQNMIDENDNNYLMIYPLKR